VILATFVPLAAGPAIAALPRSNTIFINNVRINLFDKKTMAHQDISTRLAMAPLLFLLLFSSIAAADPLAIDLTRNVPPAATCPYGPGTTTNPNGDAITVDQRSFFFNGKPWIPVVGEFHYARYPREEWRDELLKMKAGGINTVSTYVFWIHHEEAQGTFDWSDNRSLRDFIKLCQDVGLKVVVRMGPWCHGEVRNGGFPDWVQHSGTNLRSKDPAFLNLVQPFFKEEADQMAGLLWKDGGPVIGAQLDNECDNPNYLLALKDLARSVGVDVPYYAITGWQGNLPHSELIPLFGGYSDGFWGGSLEQYRREYVFTDVRAVNDLGAQLTTKNPANSSLIAQFPYACAEIGGGMMSSYDKRIKVDPNSVASLTLSKLADGNNMPGYYMYQGGINPDGKLSTLQEDHPNRMPVKDYDFQAPLGLNGQVREHYHLLREQHLFLEQFGPVLARMTPFFPDQRPSGLKDFDTLRWDVRYDGKSGFLFYNNQQPYQPLPEHKDVQFSVKTATVTTLIPRQPITIPTGSYGLWPINLDCDGVTLDYATVQPLCRVADDAGNPVYFFTELSAVRPELALAGQDPQVVTPGTGAALTAKNPSGKTVTFVVLTSEQGKDFYRISFAGRDRAILSKAAILANGEVLRLQSDTTANLALSIFPALNSAKISGTSDGIFMRFVPSGLNDPAPIEVIASLERAAGPTATTLNGTDEKTWDDAAVYQLKIPSSAQGRKLMLDLHYIGDAARLYVGDKLYDDNFYNGDPFTIALWRIPAADWPKIRLKILPYSDGLFGRLPQQARDLVNQAKKDSSLDHVTVVAKDQLELKINLP
jgi:beta-galactosidase